MGASVDHLQRHPRTGRLSFRRVYPLEVRQYIPGRPVELKRSLGASNVSEPGAMERFNAAAAEYDHVVAKARKSLTASYDLLEESTIAYLASTFERGLHAGSEQAVRDGDAEATLNGWNWATEDFREWRRDQDFDAIEGKWNASARWLLDQRGLVLDPQDQQSSARPWPAGYCHG